MWLLNPLAIILAAMSYGVSFLLYKGSSSKKEQYLMIGTMTQSISLLIAFIMPMYYLRDLSDMNAFGHSLNTTLVLIILGISLNIICKLVVRFKYQ
jgi:hypothetical protein